MKVVEHDDHRACRSEMPNEPAGVRERLLGRRDVLHHRCGRVERRCVLGERAQREEGDPLSIGHAGGTKRDGTSHADELVDESGLPDSRLSGDEDVNRHPGLDSEVECTVEPVERLGATDEHRGGRERRPNRLHGGEQ